jgi:hypothetical protein
MRLLVVGKQVKKEVSILSSSLFFGGDLCQM